MRKGPITLLAGAIVAVVAALVLWRAGQGPLGAADGAASPLDASEGSTNGAPPGSTPAPANPPPEGQGAAGRAGTSAAPEAVSPKRSGEEVSVLRITILDDETNTALPGVKVRVYPASQPFAELESDPFEGELPQRRDQPPVFAEIVTDSAGRASASTFDLRYWLIVADHPGFVVASWIVVPKRGEIEVELSLERSEGVRFRIVDVEGEPIGAAVVRLWYDTRYQGPPAAEIRADGFGVATVRLQPGMAWAISAHGYGVQHDSLSLETEEIVVVLRRAFQIGGVVVDAGGAPLPGVTVTREFNAGGREERTTDDAGRFLFTGQPAGATDGGNVYLAVDLPDGRYGSVMARAGDLHVRLALERRLRMEGVIRLPDGTPVHPEWYESWTTGPQRYRSGFFLESNGVFAWDSTEPAHPCSVTAWVDRNGRRYAGTIHITAGDVAKGKAPDLRLADAGPIQAFRSAVRVRATSRDGVALPGVQCTLNGVRRNLTKKAPSFGVGKTGRDGVATLPVTLAPGTTVRVDIHPTVVRHNDAWYLLPSAGFDVQSAVDPAAHEVVLERAVNCAFLPVTSDGTPLRMSLGSRLAVRGAPAAPNLMAKRDQRTIEYFVLPGRTYRVAIGVDGYLPRTLTAWTAPDEDGEVPIVLQTGATVRGRLLDALDRPVPEAWAGAWWGNPLALQAEGGGFAHTTAETDGTFTLRGLPAGRVTLRFVSDAFDVSVRREFELTGKDQDLGDLRFARRVLRGRVTDTGGAPVGGVTVVDAEQDYAPLTTSTHADGSFELRAPVDTPFWLRLEHPRYATAFLDGTSPDRRVVLQPPGRLTLQIDGPHPRVVRVSRPGEGRHWTPRYDDDFPRDGTHWTGLPPGPLDVHLCYLNHTVTRRVDIQANTTITLRAEIPAGYSGR